MYDFWYKNKCFKPLSDQTKPSKQKKSEQPTTTSFSIPLPPPNVTWVLHAWHALMLTIEDIITRYHRMNGKNTVWIPWTDHAWIATQVVVEKKLQAEKKLSRHDLWRQKFVKEIRNRVHHSRNTIISQIKKMGASVDRSREQFSLACELNRAVRKAFTTLFKKGKIYQSEYITNRSSWVQSVISDIEIDYKEQDSKLYFIRYFIDSKKDTITIATTRPETIFADVAIAVNPLDKRYKKYIGKKVLVPIINRTIPVIWDETVDMNFGTWALKITPTHDAIDFEIAKRHNLPMNIFAIDKNGNFTEHAGIFAGKPVEEFFDNVIKYLNDIANIEKIIDYKNTVPYCQRSGVRIQPMLTKQRFFDTSEAAKKVIDIIKSWKTIIYPEKMDEQIFHWLENIRPRCISRQLRRGHRMPIRYDENNNVFVLDEDTIIDQYIKNNNAKNKKNLIISLMLFNIITDGDLPQVFTKDQAVQELFWPHIIDKKSKWMHYCRIYQQKFTHDKILCKEIDELVTIFDHAEQHPHNLAEHAEHIFDIIDNAAFINQQNDHYCFDIDTITWSKNCRQEEDVFDTRFSSALRPLSTLWRPEQTTDLKTFFPHSLMETGYDIIFFRVARMMMMSVELVDQTPFSTIFLHGLVRDEKGRKMSKSLGNQINPVEIIEKYWADAFRLWLVIGTSPGNDSNYSEQKVEYYARFLNKLRNASRYLITKILWEDFNGSLDIELIGNDIQNNLDKCNDFDKRILHIINDLVELSQRSFEEYQFAEFGNRVINALRHDFCDRYIEITKIVKSDYTDKIVIYVLGNFIKMLHPYTPFITEKLWSNIRFEGILTTHQRPTLLTLGEPNFKIKRLIDIVTELRNIRSQAQVKPHESVQIFIQGNKDILDFMGKYEELLQKLVKTHEILYIQQDEKTDPDYITSVIINMTVWLKATKTIDKKELLASLNEELSNQEQYLQTLKTVITAPWFREKAPANVIQQKEQKIEETKQHIEKLKREIDKLKMTIAS